MRTTTDRLRDARAKTDRALACVRGDQGASPVLIAVVSEFAMKAEKAAHADDERVAVIELEQAGDSAKAAVEADTWRGGRHSPIGFGRAPRNLHRQGQAVN